jgi:hypothetical protein
VSYNHLPLCFFHTLTSDVKSLAYAELRLIVSKFFWNFDVELRPESDNWEQQEANVLWRKKPLYVKLRERERV